MAANRLAALRAMVEQNPADAFARYGLAMEHARSGDLGAAMGEFQILLDGHPEYVPAYFHAGRTLERLGRLEDAADVYRRGIDAAARAGDQHARSELQAALDLL